MPPRLEDQLCGDEEFSQCCDTRHRETNYGIPRLSVSQYSGVQSEVTGWFSTKRRYSRCIKSDHKTIKFCIHKSSKCLLNQSATISIKHSTKQIASLNVRSFVFQPGIVSHVSIS